MHRHLYNFLLELLPFDIDNVKGYQEIERAEINGSGSNKPLTATSLRMVTSIYGLHKVAK